MRVYSPDELPTQDPVKLTDLWPIFLGLSIPFTILGIIVYFVHMYNEILRRMAEG